MRARCGLFDGYIQIGPKAVVVVSGSFLKVGRIRDEIWLLSEDIPAPTDVIRKLKEAGRRVDIFTFAQELPDTTPKHPYRIEWEDLAVARFNSYDEWFNKKVNRSVRKHVRKAEREQVRVSDVPFSDELVEGIRSIYNETPVQQGRPF